MSKHKKNKSNQVAEYEAVPKPGRASLWRRRPWIIIAAVLVPLILIVAGAVYYQARLAPFQQPVITVDKTAVKMDYFLKRTKMSGNSPTNMLQQMVNEAIVKQMAPTFGISVTPQDMDNAMFATSGNLTGSEFTSWYNQQLKDSGLSDAEYTDMMRTSVLAFKLQQYFAARVPTTAQQVHLNIILVATTSDAAKAQARIQQGENFTSVARDVSLDAQSKDNGGDIGWLPRGVLPYDDTIFALSAGAVSQPVAVNPSSPTTQYLLFMVSEKAAARPIDDSSMAVLQQRALSNWILQEAPSHSIVLNYDFNNAANQAWIDWQLTKVNH